MSRKIYTYTNIQDLLSCKEYQEISTYPHITATTDLATAVQELYGEKTVVPILGIHHLVNDIIKEWKKPAIKFRQYIKLGEIIRSLIQQAGEKDKGLLLGFKRNQKDVHNAIRLLVEANIYPQEIKITNKEEKFFKLIWEKLEKEDVAIDCYRNSMYLGLENSDAFMKHINKVLGSTHYKKVVLHGFYFITPVQERIIQLMESNDIEIIFLNCFDKTLPEVHKIWLENFSVERGYPSVDKWINLSKSSGINHTYGQLFQGKIEHIQSSNITIKKYNNDMEFIEALEQLEEESVLYTTDKGHTENLLKEIFPEKFKNRHLLAYPVGQFLYYLHLMWNDLRGELILDMQCISHCFASGWVHKDGLQGKNYLYALEKMAVYFKGCKSIEAWEMRVEELYNNTNQVVYLFDNHLEQVNQENRRWHRLMGNPFINLSTFTLEKQQVKEVLILIEHIITIAKELFGSTDEIKIEEHFEKLTRILTTSKDKEAILPEEQLIVTEIFKRLRTQNETLTKCFPGDIAEAMILLLGGGFEEPDYEQQIEDDSELIKPLYQVEASSIISKQQNKKKVHLCMCDEEKMPGRVKKHPWPITDTFLDNLSLEKRPQSRKLIENSRFIIENNPLGNRYLFYMLLQNQEIEISWIAKEREKDIDASPYIKLIYMQHQIQPKQSSINKITKEDIQQIIPQEKIIDLAKVSMLSDKPSEVNLEVALCPMRYLYSYVLQEYPTYLSEFHYNFVLARMIASISYSMNMDKRKVGEQVLDLFSYLRDVEKRQILDYVEKLVDVGTEDYEGITYTDARLGVHFLNNAIVKKAQCQQKKYLEEQDDLLVSLSNTCKSKEDCMFCPHISYCINAIFTADKEKQNEN